MNSIICEPYRQMFLYMCVMVDQREALVVTTRVTDTVYFGSPNHDLNRQPLDQLAATLHFITELSGTWVYLVLTEDLCTYWSSLV
jgi:hypothetical protein